MDMNDQLIANEEEKLRLMEEIDVSTLEILQKRQTAVDLQADLNMLKETYTGLKQDIKQLDQQAEFLKGRVRECEDEFDQMQEVVSLKQLEIEQLEKQAGVKAPNIKPKIEVKMSSSAYYRAIKGDLVDEMVGNLLTQMQCTLPVRRLCDGFYLFGTKKIFIKVNKGNVIVRAAGAYQNFAEYVELNMAEEQQKIEDLKRTSEWDQEALVEYYLQEINATPSATGSSTYTARQIGVSPMPGNRNKSPIRATQGSPSKARGFNINVGRGI